MLKSTLFLSYFQRQYPEFGGEKNINDDEMHQYLYTVWTIYEDVRAVAPKAAAKGRQDLDPGKRLVEAPSNK